MKVDKFQVINLTKELIVSIENYLTNFPKSEMELKKNVRNASYDMLLIAYEANVTNDCEIRKQLIDKMIAKIKYVDFLINLCYDKKIINGKKYIKFGERLDSIVRCAVGWRKIAENQGIISRLATASGNNVYYVTNNGGVSNNYNIAYGVRP